MCANGTTVPEQCPEGYYCEEGSIPQPCPEGTYNDIQQGVDVQACVDCKSGYFCQGQGNSVPTGKIILTTGL